MLSNIARRGFASTTATARLAALRQLIKAKAPDNGVIRAMEAHSGLSAMIVEQTRAHRPDGSEAKFDCLWSSSLTSSTLKGMPDIETVDTTQRLQIVEDCLDVSSLPMIYDGDTGGEAEIFRFTVKKLERLGVGACVIEDKTGLKQNSLFGTERKQQLADVDEFCDKLAAGKDAQVTNDFMIFARVEALIAGLGQDEAMRRATAYLEKGGCDGIMIHSRHKDPQEIYEFLKVFREQYPDKVKTPIILVPTSYNSVHESELAEHGANIIIHANQLIRAAYPAMKKVATEILTAGRSQEVDGEIMPIKQVISFIDDNTGNGSKMSHTA